MVLESCLRVALCDCITSEEACAAEQNSFQGESLPSWAESVQKPLISARNIIISACPP